MTNKTTMIDGLIVHELSQIEDKRGKVMHMLRTDSPLFTKFGEIYFSLVNPGAVKAWKKHQKMTQLFTVPVGLIRLVIYDDRRQSPTFGNIGVMEIGEKNYCLVRIPPLLWYGFEGMSPVNALIVNCTDLPHDPDEADHLDISDNYIPYKWKSESR